MTAVRSTPAEAIMETANVNERVGFETAAEDNVFPVMILRRLTSVIYAGVAASLPAEPRGRRRR